MLATHIIFDFDGTLIDSSPAILETLEAVLRARGVPPVKPLNRELIGPPLLLTLQTCTGITDKGVLEELADDFRARYDSAGLYATQAYPQSGAALRDLVASGCHLHLATNKRQVPTRLLLQHFDWAQWFESVYCADSRSPAYADKGEMLKIQLQERQLDPRACVYVGDTGHDEKAAAQAGVPFIAVAWGYGVGSQAVSASARRIASLRELLKQT